MQFGRCPKATQGDDHGSLGKCFAVSHASSPGNCFASADACWHPPGLCGTRLFWLCLSFENTLAKVLKDAGPAPDSAIELPDKAVLLTEPLFATA